MVPFLFSELVISKQPAYEVLQRTVDQAGKRTGITQPDTI